MSAEFEASRPRLDDMRSGMFVSDLSVDEFVVLRQAGFSPVGLVLGSSIYHIGLQASRWGQSFELDVLSRAMHEAREIALARMIAEARSIGADGVVGTNVHLQT